MYTKIVEYKSRSLFKDYNELKLIKEIESKTDLFQHILLINEKTYVVCAAYPKDGIIASEEIHLNAEPEDEVSNHDGLKCPYCSYVDYDAFDLEQDEDDTECANCNSHIKYARKVIKNTLGECEEVIYRSSPIELNKPIHI
ncbi:hypothetical protein CON36_31685 [Bacillus cereus]|uniref:Uncharacterized protein n=1 Tax=Bacillus cereus TaxID=1396 RepID=A0A9X6XVH1_BACCE|nr:hypothetical protein [Bacillus cereus]PDZ94835.1 hypothetical protein CON36_31685 [Bacillus cereus]